MKATAKPKPELRNAMETQNLRERPVPGLARTPNDRGGRDAIAWRSTKLVATLAAVLCLWAGPALVGEQSSVPAAINYQGRLTDNYGNPVTGGYYEVQFRVWDDKTATGAGNYVWGRSFPLYVMTNGLFNVLLTEDGGSVTTPGTPKATNLLEAFEGPDRYLGLTITKNPSGSVSSPVEINPRQMLVSAPYAIHTWNASNARSLVNNTNVQVVTILGTNVGIDKTTPGTALDVGGTVTATGFAGNGSSLTSLNANNLGSGTVADARLSANVAKLNANQTFTGNNVFNAKVGIGATSPGQLLQVGDASVSNSQGLIRLASRSGTGGATRTWDIGVPETDETTTGTGYSFVIDDTQLGNTPEFMIKWGSGNVGIGTTSPGAKLDVNGDVNVGGNLKVASEKPILICHFSPGNLAPDTSWDKYDTGYSATTYAAALVGFRCDGDINEADTRVPLFEARVAHDSRWGANWFIVYGVAHHKDNLTGIGADVMFIRRELVDDNR